jgi:hypothetical protein
MIETKSGNQRFERLRIVNLSFGKKKSPWIAKSISDCVNFGRGSATASTDSSFFTLSGTTSVKRSTKDQKLLGGRAKELPFAVATGCLEWSVLFWKKGGHVYRTLIRNIHSPYPKGYPSTSGAASSMIHSKVLNKKS